MSFATAGCCSTITAAPSTLSIEDQAYQSRQVQFSKVNAKMAPSDRPAPFHTPRFINIGTTTRKSAEALLRHRRLHHRR